jgi:hypothetical protein
MPDHRHRPPVKQADPADDCRVILPGTIAFQLDKFLQKRIDIIRRCGPFHPPGHLHPFYRRAIVLLAQQKRLQLRLDLFQLAQYIGIFRARLGLQGFDAF